MSEKIVQLNEEVIKGQLKEMVRGSVEETLNELLEQEAEKLTQAARYERNETRPHRGLRQSLLQGLDGQVQLRRHRRRLRTRLRRFGAVRGT